MSIPCKFFDVEFVQSDIETPQNRQDDKAAITKVKFVASFKKAGRDLTNGLVQAHVTTRSGYVPTYGH